MRMLLCCALALAGCGAEDALVGTYSVTGLTNRITIAGKTDTTSLAGNGMKVVVTKREFKGIKLSLNAREIAAGNESTSMRGVFETDSRYEMDSVADCSIHTDWAAGGTITLQGSILEMRRTGEQDAVCTQQADYSNARLEQTLQATKD